MVLKAVDRQGVHVCSADIPGPRSRSTWRGPGARGVSRAALIGGVTLGVGAISYAGAFDIGIAADRDSYPDVEVVAAGIRSELKLLAARHNHDRKHARARSTLVHVTVAQGEAS